jgi:hypothetical protein
VIIHRDDFHVGLQWHTASSPSCVPVQRYN